MLSDAVLESGGVGRFLKPKAAGRTIAGPARHPRRTARDASRLGLEQARVAVGRSGARPSKGDRRFGERAWQDNWLRRVMQSYIATCDIVDRLISDAGLDWRTERQARFAASNVLDALAPTNFPWSNPAVLKESIDAGGANLVRGRRRSCAMSPSSRISAARRPDRVSHAISMGADLQGLLGASALPVFAVGVARCVVHATDGRTCLTGHCGCPFSHDYARPFPFEQVRLTSIYSRATASCTGNAR